MALYIHTSIKKSFHRNVLYRNKSGSSMTIFHPKKHFGIFILRCEATYEPGISHSPTHSLMFRRLKLSTPVVFDA